jgi:5-methylcytosine-specific restriction endonuclease McrA
MLWMATMPEMPVACITCGRPVPYGKSRCPAHTFQSSSRWAQHAAQHPERAAYYSSAAWRERRAAWLRDNPTCAVCGQKATAADHIVNLASGGLFDGPLQSLCKEHHRQKTQAESKLGNKRAAARRRRQP